MIRTLIYMGLIAVGMSKAPSCSPHRNVEPLYQTFRKSLKLVKKEVTSTIILTTEKVNCNEVDFHVGNKIVDTLTKTIQQIDTLIATNGQLEKTGTREEILQFAYQTHMFVENTLDNLKTLRDLYDISTYLQFETGTFFPADSFNIPPEKTDEAKKALEPVAQRIVRFFADHPRQKFEAEIACSSTPDGQEQNVKLCKGRARSVASLLVDRIRSYEDFIPHPKWIHYDIKWEEPEEAIPNADKRRGMVSIIWNVMPASLYAGLPDH